MKTFATAVAILIPAAMVLAAGLVTGHAAPAGDDAALAGWRAAFQRPTAIPYPAANPYSQAKAALGERLFFEPRVSANGRFACATCHDPVQGFADGKPLGAGVPGKPLGRHTPALWNLAWGEKFFWDGRADSLEHQAAGPIENPNEMAAPLAEVVARLAQDPAYSEAFAAAFPSDPRITAEHTLAALATYERGLVAPETRFDRWVAGDDAALTSSQKQGLALFTGKAACVNCHSGWALTDHAFHDIGLPGADLGRGPILGHDAADHAFKTPSLREIAWTAPYMHDGRFKDLDQVIDHYQHGAVRRPTVSTDLPQQLDLTGDERAALIAFLGTLSSPEPPQPMALPPAAEPLATVASAAPVALVEGATVSQVEKLFQPGHVSIRKGSALTILNNDTRAHNVRIFDDRFEHDSGVQEPGETVQIFIPELGAYVAFCGIHPKMKLEIDVVE